MPIHRPPFIIHHFTTIGSTNDHLKTMVEAPEFTVVSAAEQTSGRGRRDRTWHSTPGDGLYLSVLLRPLPHATEISLISIIAAIAVAEALIDFGATGVDVKWPNDLLIDERKISGILIEGAGAGREAMRLILGIGVNLNHQNFPPDLAETATALAQHLGRRVDVDDFRDRLLIKIARWYEVWKNGNSPTILARYAELSSYAQGKWVRVATDGEVIAGQTAGLAPSGALMVRAHDGQMRTIIAGEVRRLRAAAD
jgi:BirA family biotin operon repressor/biotin-[acetyl-CoA-carboxylase] ligase